MSTSNLEPLAYRSAEDNPADAASVEQGDPPSLVAQAFEGWDLMAEAVAETDPSLASLMSSGALLARAAFEKQIPRLLDELAELFRYGGLAESAGDDLLAELARGLWQSRCPFTREWILVQHQTAVDEFKAESLGIRAGRSLWQLVSEAIGRGVESEPADVQNPIEPPVQGPPGEWRIIATVERPSKIEKSGSLLCCTPQRRWRRHVRLEETTYQGIRHNSAAAGPVEPNAWVVLAEQGRDFDRHAPPEFAVGLNNPPEFAQALNTDEIVTGAAYFVQLDVSAHRNEVVLAFITQHGEAIRAATQTAINGAAALIPGGLLVPIGVLNMIPDFIIATVRAILNRGIAATVLPSWFVQHTVIKIGDLPPRSAVLLHSPEQRDATIVGAQMINGKMQVVPDYDDFFVPQLWPRGRILEGATLPDASANLPIAPPPELWTWVDANRHPVVWSDAWESGREPTHGFRVLLPFSPSPSPQTSRQPRGPHYVAALRVEVYYRTGQHYVL